MSNTCEVTTHARNDLNPSINPASPALATEQWVQPDWSATEAPDAWTVQLSIPGVPRDAITVHADASQIEVTARRPALSETCKTRIREFGDNTGYRVTLRVDRTLDTGAIAATHEDGVLSLRVPKHATAQRKTIPIQ